MYDIIIHGITQRLKLASCFSVFTSTLSVTGFDKTRLPHTSNSLAPISCNAMSHLAIDLEFHTTLPYVHKIAGENLKWIAYLCLEL